MTDAPAFTKLTDLASRALGGAVIWANDELFAEKENLIKPAEPVFTKHDFGINGQIYDGWETRRRRPGYHGVDGTENDQAVIRLGASGVIHGVNVDTAFFLGNYPTHTRLEAATIEGYPSPTEVLAADWTEIVPVREMRGGSANYFDVTSGRRFTHVRLHMIPDGGIARLRVHGEPVIDPNFVRDLPVDLAALRNGGRVTGCSNGFYAAPENLIRPGEARVTGEGWETARRRDDGNDYVEFRLAGESNVRVIEIDTGNFKGNAPDRVTVRGARSWDGGDLEWFPVIPETRVQPDTPHRFRLADDVPAVTHLRVDVFPDGGFSRFRAYGTFTDTGLKVLRQRWESTSVS